MPKKVHLFLLLCCFLLGFENLSYGNENGISTYTNLSVKQIDECVEKALKLFDIPGVAVGIVMDGKIVYAKGFGFCDQKNQLPITDRTLFPIMSCTKAFTAFLIGQLVDEGKLQWDDLVIDYLPEFRLYDDRTNKITIRDLLANRSGLARHDVLWYNSKIGRNDLEEDVKRFLSRLEYLEPTYPLQEKFTYNNWMYYVAGLIIEKVTSLTWENAVKERIFSRIGMHDSDCLSENSSQIKAFAQPHGERKEKQVPIHFLDISAVRAAGSIYSNINDMTKWILLQTSEGKFLGKEFLTRNTFKEIQTLQISHDPKINGPEITFGYGLGWHIGKYREYEFLDHAGMSDGFISNVAILPTKKIGVVVLTNSSFFLNLFPSAITNEIFDILLGYHDIDWSVNNLEKWKSLKKIQQEKRKEKEAKKNSKSNPSFSLEHYVGNYDHPGYGTIKIYLENGQLFANYYRLTIPLNHWEQDIFEASEETEDPVLLRKNFSFFLDSSGKIHTLCVSLEPTIPPIGFQKQN